MYEHIAKLAQGPWNLNASSVWWWVPLTRKD